MKGGKYSRGMEQAPNSSMGRGAGGQYGKKRDATAQMKKHYDVGRVKSGVTATGRGALVVTKNVTRK